MLKELNQILHKELKETMRMMSHHKDCQLEVIFKKGSKQKFCS